MVANSDELWVFLHIFGDVISRIPRFSVSVRKLTLLKFVFIKDEGYPWIKQKLSHHEIYGFHSTEQNLNVKFWIQWNVEDW